MKDKKYFSISIIIPTYNASKYLSALLQRIKESILKEKTEILIIDSSSTDNTIEIARSFNTKIITIPKHKFDHGGTRTNAGKIAKGEILIYLTQDALPSDKYAIRNLIIPFYKDEKISVTFGRQLPHSDATPFAKHLRIFNYPDKSYVRSLQDKERYGLKTCFCSNSFAAYRKSALEKIGWFKNGLIVSEDSYAVAKMILKGYKVAYVSEAMVYHSHNYTLFQEVKRYFDIGVFHRNEKWIKDIFGCATKQGKKYVISELKFLLRNHYYHLVPEFVIRNFFKYLGYKLGYNYRLLPLKLIKRLSFHTDWWQNKKF